MEQTYTATYAHGMHFELEGVGKIGQSIFGLGAFVDTSFQETCGYGEATINGTGTGGTVANIIPSNYSEAEKATLKLYGFNWRCALWKKSLMTDTDGNPYRDSEGNEFLVPIVGYVVTNVKCPFAAPTGVNAYLSGNGFQVTVDWISSPDGNGALAGYYVYRICDNQDPVQVNSDILAASSTQYVDTSELRSGKIYSYYVTACYNSGNARYLTMNSKSSSVTWGIPLLSEVGSKYTGSIFGNGSLAMVVAMAALGLAAASLGITLSSKKKTSDKTEEEE